MSFAGKMCIRDSDMAQYYVGVDVGGTTVKMGMFSDTGELLDKWEIPTRRKNNGKYILSDIVDSIEEKRETFEGNIKGIGVGIPGPVTADGTVLKCANLGWDVFSVSNKLASLTGVGNVKVGNLSLIHILPLAAVLRQVLTRQASYHRSHLHGYTPVIRIKISSLYCFFHRNN